MAYYGSLYPRRKPDDFAACKTANPGLAEATVAAPPKRDRAWNEAADRVVKTYLLVLQGYGLDETSALHALRGLRSAIHGFATLERHGGFGLPLDVDQSFEWMLESQSRFARALLRPAARLQQQQ